MRGAGRLLAAADREDLGVARGSRGVEELRRVALDDTSPEGGQIELIDHEPDLLDGVVAGPMIPHSHRRQVSHDEDPVPVEVGAAVKPLGVGLLLGRDVGQTVPDPRHGAASRAHRHRPQAVQRLRRQRFDIQRTPGGIFIDGGDDVADRRRTLRTLCEHGDHSSSQLTPIFLGGQTAPNGRKPLVGEWYPTASPEAQDKASFLQWLSTRPTVVHPIGGLFTCCC